MTIQECYDALGGDFKDVMGRLKKEDRVARFAVKFLGDGSYQLLMDSLKAKDYKEAFRAAHSMKGVCQNLGFSQLFVSSDALTEELRGERYTDKVDGMFAKVTEDYDKTVAAIRQYQEENA